ncbi:MAG: hypothetical protein J6R04_00050 [Clostridia bacterium]|nr:hypothetical protein [Clostridia bacterium]
MSNKIKNIVTTFVFVGIIALFVVLCAVRAANPVEYSDVEKRPLAQFPENITWESIVDKTTINAFDKYTVEQFPMREFFRTLKAKFALNVLNLKENNGYAVEDGSIAEIKPDYNQEILDYQIGRLEYAYDKYLAGNGGKHYLALVPDKNYYLGVDYGYPMPDYAGLVEQMKQKLDGMEYVDLFDSLELEDYYKTDWHWDQSKLDDVLATLGEAMGFGDRLSGEYTENVLEDFRGGYYDQSALYPSAEQMIYLTNKVLEDCTVYDYENGKTYGLYNHELYTSKTPYDFFLSGTRALLRIDNPNATTDKKLVVFRDSYGASLVPLMAEGYASIYVVDIRYVHPDLITRMIGSVEGMDVLYVLSTTVLSTKSFK